MLYHYPGTIVAEKMKRDRGMKPKFETVNDLP